MTSLQCIEWQEINRFNLQQNACFLATCLLLVYVHTSIHNYMYAIFPIMYVHIHTYTYIRIIIIIISLYIRMYVGPPSPIASITASDTSCLTTNVIVSWDPSTSDPVCEPLSYNVMISPDGMMMMINDTTYNFTTLTPGTTYTVTVAANNMAGVGQSNMTMFYIITMSEALPSGEFILYMLKLNMCLPSLMKYVGCFFDLKFNCYPTLFNSNRFLPWL